MGTRPRGANKVKKDERTMARQKNEKDNNESKEMRDSSARTSVRDYAIMSHALLSAFPKIALMLTLRRVNRFTLKYRTIFSQMVSSGKGSDRRST